MKKIKKIKGFAIVYDYEIQELNDEGNVVSSEGRIWIARPSIQANDMPKELQEAIFELIKQREEQKDGELEIQA